MPRFLLVLGGGAFAVPTLRWAREAGLTAVLVDPDARSLARRAAQEFHPIPHDDAAAHVALARRLQKVGGLAGILAAEERAFSLLAPLAEAVEGVLPPRRVLERLQQPERMHAALREQGLALERGASEPATGAFDELDLFAFLREGAFVPCGLAVRRSVARGDVLSVQPSGLEPAAEHAAYVLVERAARALGLERGLLQATLVERDGALSLSSLRPGFADLLGASHVARLVHGKSPLQAWFGHLAGADGPFDELVLAPRAVAGWLAIAPVGAGRFAGVDGLARARAVPGLVDLWVEEPGRELGLEGGTSRPLGYLWAEGHARAELEETLRAARAALEVRVATHQRVA